MLNEVEIGRSSEAYRKAKEQYEAIVAKNKSTNQTKASSDPLGDNTTPPELESSSISGSRNIHEEKAYLVGGVMLLTGLINPVAGVVFYPEFVRQLRLSKTTHPKEKRSS